MTEEEARAWLACHDVSREAFARLNGYVALLLDEMQHQNLIAQSTRDHVWARHIVDSAQLLPLAPAPKMDTGRAGWIDLGSGAGLPGVIIAILSPWLVTLVESRRRRIDFLAHVVAELRLDNVRIFAGKVETLQLEQPATVISARAFAPMPRLFATAHHLADAGSFWLLPKGKSWQSDIDDAAKDWHGLFHVEHSVTDPDSAVVVARSVRRKGRR
ncbi:16S rRNA (guanine(527)-N(7))-methyltransferase RsmG [Sphingobium algorifonticola]|uniref:Ribosomal RNA small subunit methyltransferase G n=1 Tax=Sphingobium algorifonticola TaxID=2008318 RepID=A0A437JD44_9SPHN|nr:16S rRNA (guanine(527)-N(7))-methyltransferase RsmG [Sphingobium algorifonticola]RVT43839.1 16S rRNA (guanine(527)-N(7))-methyltransferase RsmG [Sphingobium algorifonticola]